MSIQYKPTGRNAKAISESVETAVRTGRLAGGAELPSVRALAHDLGVAPGTVAAAYRALRERGVIETRGRSGTSVRLHPPLAARSASAPLPEGVRDLASGQPSAHLLPSLVPVRGAIGGAATAPGTPLLPELIDLARERLIADGVPADHVTLAGGGLDGISRVLSVHLRPGDVIALEDPGWPNTLDLAGALGLHVRPMPLDAHGPTPAGLRRALAAGARAVVVTSRAQNPTGAYLTPTRAVELRRVLSGRADVLVVEDDHAAELASVPLATLAGATTSWAFVRSASKPYGPDLRVSVVAGDEVTVARVAGRMRISSGWVSSLLQDLTLALMRSPRAAAMVAQAAAAYDERRDALIDALAARGVPAHGDTGLNVWVPVSDETDVVSGLLRAGWAVAPGARFRQSALPGIRVTVGSLDPRRDVPSLADAISGLLHAPPPRYTT